ncbi:MAG: hypothetical protein ACE3JQ_12100 [Paenisporosarcina sp.]
MFVLIILGIFAVLIVFGVAYDLFVRKSFREAKRGNSVNQSAERAKMDATTNQIVNRSGGYLP